MNEKSNKETNAEITASVDFLPNWVRSGQTKIVEDFLRKNFESSLSSRVARYGELPVLLVQFAPFDSLIREARELYISGYYRAAAALCGMTIESLCIAIAEERIGDESLKEQLTNPSIDCRKKIGPLKKYLRIAKSASLLHKVLDIRKDYLHLHEKRVNPKEILKCICLLHLALIAEYGLIPAEGGKARFATEKDIQQLASGMGIQL